MNSFLFTTDDLLTEFSKLIEENFFYVPSIEISIPFRGLPSVKTVCCKLNKISKENPIDVTVVLQLEAKIINPKDMEEELFKIKKEFFINIVKFITEYDSNK